MNGSQRSFWALLLFIVSLGIAPPVYAGDFSVAPTTVPDHDQTLITIADYHPSEGYFVFIFDTLGMRVRYMGYDSHDPDGPVIETIDEMYEQGGISEPVPPPQGDYRFLLMRGVNTVYNDCDTLEDCRASDGYTGVEKTVTYSVPDAPPTLAAIAPQSVTEGDTVSFTATSTDSDGDKPTYRLSGAPSGAAIDPVSALFSWDTGNAEAGEYHFAVVVDDGRGGTDSKEVSIVVASPPVPVEIETVTPAASGISSHAGSILAGTSAPNPLPGVSSRLPSATPVPASVTGAVLGAFTFSLPTALGRGSSGVVVTELQRSLKEAGLYFGPATGYWGPATDEAVAAFEIGSNWGTLPSPDLVEAEANLLMRERATLDLEFGPGLWGY